MKLEKRLKTFLKTYGLNATGRLVIKKLGLVLSGIFLGCLVWAAAQEEGLYAPAPPADAAFVRVFNAGRGNVSPTLGATEFQSLSYSAVSPYQVVLQGSADLSAGDVTDTVKLQAGRFYTVIVGEDAALIEDPTLGNRAQTLLLLYNLASEPVNLKTADGSTDVIPEVAPGEVGSIPVNPISVAFGAFSGSTLLTAFDEVQLERSAAYSTFVLPDDTAVFIQNTTATE